MEIRKIGAFVATDGRLFADATAARQHSIELELRNWFNSLSFDSRESVSIDRIVSEIAADADRVSALLSIKVA